MKASLVVAAGVVAVSLSGAAMAAPPSSPAVRPGAADKAAAEALFEEGRRLLKAGKIAEACAKFEASEKHEPAAGTILNLAGCFEKNGQTASAWSTFKEAEKASLARNKPEWVALARQHIADLEPKLVRLRVVVAANAPAGIVVKRDGVVLERGEWGTGIPIDPGDHAVEAAAPGRRTWVGQFNAPSGGGDWNVAVPLLEAAPSGEGGEGAKPSVVTVVVTKSTSPVRTAAYVVGGVGIVGLAVGIVSAIVASGKRSDAASHCSSYPDHCSSDHAADQPNAQAQSWATVSTIAFVAGGALSLAGAALVLAAPKGERSEERVSRGGRVPSLTPSLALSPGGASMGLSGHF